jgi:hypothetical protein
MTCEPNAAASGPPAWTDDATRFEASEAFRLYGMMPDRPRVDGVSGVRDLPPRHGATQLTVGAQGATARSLPAARGRRAARRLGTDRGNHLARAAPPRPAFTTPVTNHDGGELTVDISAVRDQLIANAARHRQREQRGLRRGRAASGPQHSDDPRGPSTDTGKGVHHPGRTPRSWPCTPAARPAAAQLPNTAAMQSGTATGATRRRHAAFGSSSC